MAPKRKPDNGVNSTEDDISQSSSTSASTITSTTALGNVRQKTRKVPNPTHGLKFESKLLVLFCIRALGAGYKFELTKEREDLGGKFDDVIFRYQVRDDTPKGKHWRYRYLQAKHKLNESDKIKANDLLQDNDKGDFSLLKYFRSFCKMKARGEDIHDCILCTNIAFDVEDLKRNGIELVSLDGQPEDILEFGRQQKTARYKLQLTEAAQEIRDKMMNEYSNVQHLAKQLHISAQNPRQIVLKIEAFNSYHVALINEHVIDFTTHKFHSQFVNQSAHLSDGAKLLRQTINDLVKNDDWKNWNFNLSKDFGKVQSAAEVSNALPLKATIEDINDFFDKLVFVVKMPNQIEFKNILQTQDVYKYYPEDESSVQTGSMLTEMSDKFTNKDVGYWLTSEEGKTILLNGVIKLSSQYRDQLENEMGFNKSASLEMAGKLNELLASTNTVERITTPSPTYTAVKVISAIEILNPEPAVNINYLVTSSTELQSAEVAQRWRNIIGLPTEFEHFVLVVCEDDGDQQFIADEYYANLFPVEEEKTKRKKVMVISRNGAALTSDVIDYTQLSDSFKQKILSKIVSFQETNESVGRLVGIKPEDVIDSLEELLRPLKEQSVIKSFDTTRFEKSLYIKRRMKFAFDDNFNAELARRLECTVEKLHGECRINSRGQIEWFVDGKRRKEIWEKVITMNDKTSCKIEEDLIRVDDETEDQPVMIITGVAGSGKSTLLSHYYSEIKKTKPDYWVIRINLVEHSDAISKFNKWMPDLIAFLINDLHIIDGKSPFSRSLLKHRLKTGDRIVFMFDGFDEISGQYQEIAIQLMKSIRKQKNIQLYVTTRPHMAHNLQDELCQLAYSLDNLSENDQTHYLASYWMGKLQLSKNNKKVIEEFAKLLVTRVSQTLKDKERDFIGIPLQCRILADCYLPNIDEIMRNNTAGINDVTTQSQQLLNLFENQKFDLISLYSRLMNTKRQIFRVEKTNGATCNQIVANSVTRLIKQIELQLTKLAVETIITGPKTLQLFWPSNSYQSIEDEDEEEDSLAKDCLLFGITFSTGNAMRRQQFLHRTFAEYFVAKYLYEGFILDDRRHNKLLENESIRKLIVNNIFAGKQYDGVQVFFDSMVRNLVDENEEWRSTIARRQLPQRLKKFTENLFTQLLRQSQYTNWIGNRSIGNSFTANALKFSLSNGKGNIFILLCDCLDSTFEKKQVNWAMLTSFIARNHSFSFTSLPESKSFTRFIDYFDIDPDNPIMKIVMDNITRSLFPDNEVLCGLTNSLWNGDEQQQIMTHLIDFLANHFLSFDKYCKSCNPISIIRMLTFLVCHDKYRSHLEIFLKLLSQLEVYSNDLKFFELLMRVFESKELMPGQITKTLDILNGLGRHSLLVQLYGKVPITIDPEAFRNIYQPVRLEKDDAMLNDMDNLLKRDSYNMTHLHAAAFHGDTDLAEQIFATIRQGGLDPDNVTEVRRMVFESDTSFHFAAYGGHEKICCTILAFVKDIFPDELKCEFATLGRFICGPLNHAMRSDNVEMLRLILKVVKKELGHNDLLGFVKSTSVPDWCKSKEIFNAMAKIIVDRNGIVDYNYLDDLVFNNEDKDLPWDIQKIDAELLQGLLSLKGAATFTKRILDRYDSPSEGFHELSYHVLPHLSKDQLLDVFEMITTRNDSVVALDDGTSCVHSERIVQSNSIWEQLLRSMSPLSLGEVGDVVSIIDCFANILGGDLSKQLLLHQDDDGYIIIRLHQELVKRMLNCLPQKSQEEIKLKWKENPPTMAHDSFIPLDSRNSWEKNDITRYNINVLRFFLNYGSDVQLKECVNVITCVPLIRGRQQSVWSDIIENCRMEETSELFKSISKILGREAVSELVLQMKVVFPGRIFFIWEFIYFMANSRCTEGLPQEIRDDIQQTLELKAARWIEEFVSHQVYIDECQGFFTLEFFQYCRNDEERTKFVQNLMTLKTSNKNMNIWAYMFLKNFWCNAHDYIITTIDTFFKSVTGKL